MKPIAKLGLAPIIISVAQMASVFRKTGNVTTTVTVLTEKMNSKDALLQRARRINLRVEHILGTLLTVSLVTGAVIRVQIVRIDQTKKPATIGPASQMISGVTIPTCAYQNKRNATEFTIAETIATNMHAIAPHVCVVSSCVRHVTVAFRKAMCVITEMTVGMDQTNKTALFPIVGQVI